MSVEERDTRRGRTRIVLLAAILIAGAFIGILRAPVVGAAVGTPDQCGYAWTDSHSPPPRITYNWTEIQPTGNRIENWTDFPDDTYAGPFPLGFDFMFYGVTYSEVFVSTNGYLTFGQGDGAIPVDPIPSTYTPDNFAMPFGADLLPANAIAPAGVYYERLSDPARFVVEFNAVPHYDYDEPIDPNLDPVTFEVVLSETGEILFQYATVAGDLYVVGVEGSGGVVGSPYNVVDVGDNVAVLFASAAGTPGPVGVGLGPCTQLVRGAPGLSVDAAFTVTNLGTAGQDTFEMTYVPPPGWSATFYDADGTTPLTDTNSDGNPDTGPLNASGGSRDVRLRVDVPANATGIEEFTVTATSSADNTVSASASATLEIKQAALAPPHSDYGTDTDGDGLFDFLVVNVSIAVGVADTYQIYGTLRDPSLVLDLYQYVTMYLDVGLHTIRLEYPGDRINASGVDGPYIAYLELATLYQWLDSGTYFTTPYSHFQFESPPADFDPPFYDFPVDTDGNALDDYVAMVVNITVNRADQYVVYAYMHDPSYQLALQDDVVTYLDVGSQAVEFEFDGHMINGSGMDGPYIVDLWMYLYFDGLVDTATHTTGVYSHTQFEPPYAIFAPPHSDTGLDFDGDGPFEFLAIDVSVWVNIPGVYTIGGSLYDPFGTFYLYDQRSRPLDVGANTVRLYFSGLTIYTVGVNGPYYSDLYLYDVNGSFLDHDSYVTQFYAYSDFDGDPLPQGALFPPHVDFGWDTDGNGLYDTLVVDVSVAVGYGSWLSLDAVLHDSTNALVLYAYVVTYLNPGVQTIRLSFDGMRINASGVDGPYTVDLILRDYDLGIVLDTGTHTTAAYSHLDFDGPPGSFTPPHEDRGIDTDADGRFNELLVQAHVNTDYAGTFTAIGVLHGPDGWNSTLNLNAVNITYLNGGAATVDFAFSGYRINGSGVDGPYMVELYLYDGTYGAFLDNDTYWTAPYLHTDFEEPPSVVSAYSSERPTIDGAFSAGEWADAYAVDLAAIEGNQLPGYLLVKDDNEFLYIAYDAVGDNTPDPQDGASFSFDTGNDGIATLGAEDEFVQGGWAGQSHWVYSMFNWTLEDGPFDPSLPNHAGLAGARGFGPSSENVSFHRIYEFRIPLALLGAGPGDVLGFFGGSYPSPGLVDISGFRYSTWPEFVGGPIPLSEYGDLVLSPDRTKPTIAITSPSDGALIASDSVTVTWTAADIGAGLDYFEMSVDAGIPSAVPGESRTETVTGLTDGAHLIEVTAVDGAGNVEVDSVSVVVDTTPPAVSIDGPAEGAFLAASTVTLEWTASDPVSGLDRFEVTLDDGLRVVLPAGAVSYAYSGVPDGPHTLAVTAFDIAGHARTVSVNVIVDTTLPTLTVQAPAAGELLSSGTVTLTWAAADSGSGLDRFEASFDGSSAVVVPGTDTSYAFSGVADGSHTIALTAFDRAGNVRAASRSFTVDATAPSLTIDSPADQTIVPGRTIAVTWTATDATSGIDHFELTLDGGNPVLLGAGVSTYAFAGVADGSHTVDIRAIDRAGHTQLASVTLVVDTTAPMLSLSAPTLGAVVGTPNAVVTWTASDASSGIDRFELSLDGGSAITVAGTAATYTFTGVADGIHSVTVTAVDRAGNRQSASSSFTVDATAPTLAITGPASGAIVGTSSLAVTWTASDGMSGLDRITVSLDGAAPTTLAGGATSFTFTGVADGSHTITIVAIDAAGNSQTDSVQITVDTFVLSPSGPYGLLPLAAVIGAIVAAIVAGVFLLRRRRGGSPPEAGT